MHEGQPRVLAARLLEPDDRFVGMRLQQVNDAEPAIPGGDGGFVRAEANGLLEIGDDAVDRAGQEFAPADMGISGRPAAVERDRRLIFGYRLGAARFGA